MDAKFLVVFVLAVAFVCTGATPAKRFYEQGKQSHNWRFDFKSF